MPGQKRLSYGGTYYSRLAMPYMELNNHDGYEVFLSWQIQAAQDGHLRAMDTQGNFLDPDVIVVQRFMHRDAPEMFRRAIACGQVIINDLDDNFWKLPKTNVAYEATSPTSHPDFNRDHYRKSLAASSAITVATPGLAKEVAPLKVPTFLCRNMLDIERWHPQDPGSAAYVGWVGGLQWRSHDLEVLGQFLPRWLAESGASFFHGGDSQVPGVRKVWDVIGIDTSITKVATAPLCHISDYPQLYKPLSVSLIPLEDVPFNSMGKSALKAAESSAAGLPYIASDLPEQRWFTEHGGMGRLAKNYKPQQWLRHLDELSDPEVRRIEGAANRKHAEQFDIRDNWQQWANVLNELVEPGMAATTPALAETR